MTEATTTDRVFATLREWIVSGELAAGSQHSIYRLAELLEVSRTPVRDAVLRLADLGLVTIERNRGVRVHGVTADDVRSVFELRILLEVPAVAHTAAGADDATVDALDDRLAAMRAAEAKLDELAFTGADREFHVVAGSLLDNSRLRSEINRLRDTIQARGVSTIGRSRPMGEIVREHALIADAVRSRDAHAAAVSMVDHLERTGYLLMRQVSASADEIDPSWAARVRALVIQ